MARQPTDYDVDVARVSPHHGATVVRTGPTAGAPAAFSTTVYVDQGKISVIAVIVVRPGGQASMVEATIQSGPATGSMTGPLTTSAFRRILVDQIVKAALAEATVEMPPDEAEGTPTGDRVAAAASVRATRAAHLYLAAQAAGSRAPVEEVAAEMAVSRRQASRYLRAARAGGMLPPA